MSRLQQKCSGIRKKREPIGSVALNQALRDSLTGFGIKPARWGDGFIKRKNQAPTPAS